MLLRLMSLWLRSLGVIAAQVVGAQVVGAQVVACTGVGALVSAQWYRLTNVRSGNVRSRDFSDHFDFHAGSHGNLRNAESRASMLALLPEYLDQQFRRAIGNEVVFGEVAR
ncbi:MAG: hypothetical protein JWR22_3979 [Herminiimonas sp.]|nr:hypothetical protein [Herminiimonas sp.]